MTDVTVELDTGEVMALPVLPTSVDVQVIASDCRLVGWSLRDTSTPAAQDGAAQVVAPGAGAAIVTLSGLRAGTYDVVWQVGLQGAAAAADANNFQLKNGVTVVENSDNAGAAGAYSQVGARITVPVNGTVTVNAIGAGTAGVTYLANVELTPSQVGATVVEIQDTGNILGEVSLPPGGSETDVLDHFGVLCQGRISVHVISGQVTGVVYARLYR
jgi:hypothetical protein